jgi:hypothetical protein
VSLNPAIYWTDVSNKPSYYIEKKKNKGSQMGHTKKKFDKEKIIKHQRQEIDDYPL